MYWLVYFNMIFEVYKPFIYMDFPTKSYFVNFIEIFYSVRAVASLIIETIYNFIKDIPAMVYSI